MNKFGIGGVFKLEHIRDGRVIDTRDFHNGVVDAGLNKMLDVMFHGVTALGTWYLGLIDSVSYTALAAADTMASHAGWIECDNYTEAARPEWTEGAASSKSITNSTAVTFTMNASDTIKGIFVTSDATKNGVTGTLWATGTFTADVVVVSGDLIKVTYTLTAAED